MPLDLFNDALDDTPVSDGCDGFTGADFTLRPDQLTPDTVRDGENIWFDSDLAAQTRPGLRFNTLCDDGTLGAGVAAVQGMGFYDTPTIERTLAVRAGKLYEIDGAGVAASTAVLAGATGIHGSARVQFAQLIDRMFFSDGVLRWARYTGAWSHGSVTTFADASAMPAWRMIFAHNFRLFAVESGGNYIYVSDIGAGEAAANWARTANVRVGSGEGDPVVSLVAGQAGNLVVLCAASAWVVDTTEPDPANWIVRRITQLTGCVAPQTAISTGQDVLFLSRYGLTSLGSLATTDSLNPAQTLSAPIRPLIDRVNWAAIGTAWATVWRDLYLLALPLDLDTQPRHILPYNQRTKRWATPWTASLGGLILGSAPGQAILADDLGLLLIDEAGNAFIDGGTPPGSPFTIVNFEGFSAAAVVRFGERQETLIADNTGRILRIDPDHEKDDNLAEQNQEIPSWVTLKAHHFDTPQHIKQPFMLEVQFRSSSATGVQLNLVRDALEVFPARTLEEAEIIATDVTTGTLGRFPLLFPIQFRPNTNFRRSYHLRRLPRFRECGLQVYCPRGRLRLRTVRFAAFVDSPDLTNRFQ